MNSPLQTPDLIWALIYGSLVGVVLAITLVSMILLSQRRYRISQQQKLEAVRKSEEKYRDIVNFAPVGIYKADRDGVIRNVNPAFVKMLGYESEDELVGKMMCEHICLNGEDQKKYIFDFAEKCETFSTEIQWKKKDGTAFWVHLHAHVKKDVDGKVQYIQGFTYDITLRREAVERYRELFEESKDAVFISTPAGKFFDINPAGVELFGYASKEELLQLDIARDLYWNPAQRVEFERLIRRQGYVKDLELELKRKDGQKVIVQETTTVVRDAAGKIIAYRGILRDITNQRNLEDQIRQAQKMESIGTLAGGIAHDFNNILAIILGHVAVLERCNGDKDKFRHSIDALNKAVQRGTGLVKQILTFARKTGSQPEPLNINVAVQDVLKILSETFPKTIVISDDLDVNLPIIIADPIQVHQVLLNLCVNAYDAIMEAERKARAVAGVVQLEQRLMLRTGTVSGDGLRSKFSDTVAEQYVVVSVSDSGTGIDDSTRAHMFEPFFTTKEKGKGTGLGLSVVYGVMKSHKGFVDVESELGRGTTFHLYFPVPPRSLELPVARVARTRQVPRGHETILVVEDEELLLELVQSFLEDKGYTVLTARDGQEAVEVYARHKDEIELVLSDMGLPKMGGWEAFRRMREIDPNVKAILASGYLDPNVRSEMLKAGAKDFVQKPYDIDEILVRLREAIES